MSYAPFPMLTAHCVAIGNCHLEYGFPSTHSTNSVSIALFFYGVIQHVANREDGMSLPTYLALVSLMIQSISPFTLDRADVSSRISDLCS